MEFVQKAASTVVRRALLELEAMPRGTGDTNTAMAVIGLSNVVMTGIAHCGPELELPVAIVPETDAKDPLEGMSESKVDFDNPTPTPSLIAAIEASKDECAFKCATKMINGAFAITRLSHNVEYDDRIELKRHSSVPSGLEDLSEIVVSEQIASALIGRHRSFLASRRYDGASVPSVYFASKFSNRRYYKIGAVLRFLVRHRIHFAVRKEMMAIIREIVGSK